MTDRRWSFGEIFHHVDTDGTERMFCLPLLNAAYARNPRRWTEGEMELTARIVDHVWTLRGIEAGRVAAYPMARIDEPGIGCLFPDGGTLTVDGNHRLVKRWELGLRTMVFRVAPERVWRHCLARPEEVRSVRTGLPLVAPFIPKE